VLVIATTLSQGNARPYHDRRKTSEDAIAMIGTRLNPYRAGIGK
jgi:hypothetical protein